MEPERKVPPIPWMRLGDPNPESSLTPPPAPFPASNTAADNARQRFAVTGNAPSPQRGLSSNTASEGLALLDLPTSLTKSKDQILSLEHDFPSAKILSIPCNVTLETVVQSAIETASTHLGNLKILCCFAGIVNCVPSIEMSLADYQKMQDVNTTGAWIAAQTIAKKMIHTHTRGKILFISSISGHRVNYPQPQLAYNISKAGLLHMKNCLAAEWAQYGIQVNSISPGYMDTVLNEGEGLVEHRGVWADRNPMRRMGQPNELTGPVVLLCSDVGGSYLNGVDVVVDGGGLVF
ncbi:oxidoreductase [Aspergillus sclerotioniger CBS 115572]|uniref:Oxidoreductase n=1 Tax=Aspergillus sclerotioniger CBS 115572 TaxID=1450535 RepID=A0A317V4W7_9EURO|nr:oxidoreductase [Aspergillus sclerotioniger CBS 115572]PWY69026.1 oxidoreductase [Aspergillus sclerotioniger CBS 115572]